MASDLDVSVKVEGVRELVSALRKVDRAAPKAVSAAHKHVAQIVTDEAQRRAAARPRKVRTNTLAPRIRARGSQREAAVVVLGHPRKRGAQGSDAKVQEFGGRAPLFGNKSKWFTVRPKQKGGYFLFPAIKAKRDVVRDTYIDALEKSLKESF